MVSSVTTTAAKADPPAIFQGYVLKSVQLSLTRIQQAESDLAQGEIEAALRTLSYSLKLPEAWPDNRALLLALAPRMEQAGYRDAWMPYLEQGIDHSQQMGDTAAEAELRLQLGILLQLRGLYSPAQTHLEASLRGYTLLNDPDNQARALNRLALVAHRRRRFETATGLITTALSLLAEDSPERAYSYFILGMVALDRRAWPEAVDELHRAAALWRLNQDRRMGGRTLTLLGSAFHRLEQYAAAIEAYHQAIDLLEAVNDPVHKAMAQMNLGNVYESLERPHEALELHLPAEQVFRRVQDQLHLAHVHHNLAMVYRRLRRWAQAEASCRFSLDLWPELGNVERLVNTLDELGTIYFEQGRLVQAEAVFTEALDQLRAIAGEPGYDHKRDMVAADLHKTREAIAHRQQ